MCYLNIEEHMDKPIIFKSKTSISIEYINNYLKSYHPGSKCLTEQYINNHTQMEWQCDVGHIWKTTWTSIQSGKWCHYCTHHAKPTIEYINNFIEMKHPGGKCLDMNYIDAHAKMNWQCQFGHIWKASWNKVYNCEHWCHVCSNQVKITISEIIQFISDKHPGGSCLSNKYINENIKMKWQCEFEHIWLASWNSIRWQDSWCPHCSPTAKPTLEEIQIFIEKNNPGGKCLDSIYINSSVQMNWKCVCGHTWNTCWSSIYSGTWCPKCANQISPTIEDIQNFLNIYRPGGKCLDKIYINNHTKMKWECRFGHVWEARWQNIYNNKTWCPECSKGLGERCCRFAFEQLFELPFKTAKPKWLKNPKTNGTLELDGFNEYLKIAFEYQGNQHFKIIEKFGGTPEKLRSQQERDEIKRQMCKKRSIFLIEIPQFNNKFRPEQLKDFIKQKCIKDNITLPENYDSINLNFAGI